MKIFLLVVFGMLCAASSPAAQEYTEACDRCTEVCENLAEHAALSRKVLVAMLIPERMAEVLSEMQAEAERGNVSAYLALGELETYRAALDGDPNVFAQILRNRPFAVFTDGAGGGLVLYPSGWGFRLGSRMGKGFIIRITAESMTIRNPKTDQAEIVTFGGVYLAGKMVNEGGIGMPMADSHPLEDLIRGWRSTP